MEERFASLLPEVLIGIGLDEFAQLASEFDTLEELEPDEDGVRVDVAGTLEEVTAAAVAAVEQRLRSASG